MALLMPRIGGIFDENLILSGGENWRCAPTPSKAASSSATRLSTSIEVGDTAAHRRFRLDIAQGGGTIVPSFVNSIDGRQEALRFHIVRRER